LIKHEFVRFLFVGVVNTVFGYVMYLLFNLVFSYQVAYTGAYLTGIVFSYFLNTKLVFKTATSWKSFFAFPLVYVVQYLIGIVFLNVLIEKFGVSELIAPFAIIVLSIPVTFLLSRYVVKPTNVS